MSPVLYTLLVGLSPASADGLTPYLAAELMPIEHARAVSLDVRGTVLSAEESRAILTAGGLDATTLDAWLASEAFADQVARHHKSLFLNNVDFSIDPARSLRNYGQYQLGVYFVYDRTKVHRGALMTNCTDYDADINALNQPQSWLTRGDGSLDEGAIDVHPWWDIDTTVRVCAFDAQLTEVSSSGNDCSTAAGQEDPECGCGPNLMWCGNNTSVEQMMTAALSDAVSERVRDVVYTDLPYSTLLTEPSVYLNGPLVAYYTHRVDFSDTLELPVPVADLPDIPADEADTWVEVPTDTQYAGALTEPGWLLRFQTNRGRANRFFTEFLCGEFLPPESGIMEVAEENPTPDLGQKPVCRDCHSVLEPWAAYWGRWKEVGATYYTEDAYPTFSDECYDCAPNCSDPYCKFSYMTQPDHPHEEDYVGWFNPYVFLFGDTLDHPSYGPALWADTIRSDGRLSRCAAEKAAIWLLGKPVEDISPELIDMWADDFSASGLSYQAMVRSIVTSPAYGRAR